MFRGVLVLLMAIFATGCASSVRTIEGAGEYAYQGEKYGQISIVLSEALKQNPQKSAGASRLGLEAKLKDRLISEGVYDESSENKVEVVINNIRLRGTFSAVMFGALAGADSLKGTVKLASGEGEELSSFDVSAAYALGGTAGGVDEARIGWLSDKFAQLAANTISGKRKK